MEQYILCSCGKRFRVTRAAPGRTIRCHLCGVLLTLEAFAEEQLAPQPPPPDAPRQVELTPVAEEQSAPPLAPPEAPTPVTLIRADVGPVFLVGRKNQCPICGSTDVRPMGNERIREFYAGDQLVWIRPRFCRTCGREWEVRPPRSVCYVMIVLGLLGVLFGAGMLIFSAIFPVVWLLLGPPDVWRRLRTSFGALALGLTMGLTIFCASFLCCRKHAGYLGQTRWLRCARNLGEAAAERGLGQRHASQDEGEEEAFKILQDLGGPRGPRT
jgi:hypothetical protein